MTKNWLKKYEKWLLAAVIAAAVLLIYWLCAAKYGRYAYNGIDLAYFNQVFWNTIHGRFFEQSIHPHLSLGDHAELIILALTPLYYLWPDPRCLLLMQAAALALCAWPIWLLAREGSAARRSGFAPLGFAVAWLLNPLIGNVALFEFHILPFAIFPLLMAALAYHRGRVGAFLAWSLAALIVREDVALVVAAYSLLAWVEHRARIWRVLPLALGSTWFLGAMMLIRHFAPAGGYKYSVYYAWLGTAWMRPWEIAAHMLTLANLEMALGFLMAAAFLPLAAWRPLVLAVGPLAQILLGAPGGGEIVLETHYASLFLPALALAAIDGYDAVSAWLARHATRPWVIPAVELRRALPLFGVFAVAYAAWFIGPMPTSFARAIAPLPASAAAAEAAIAAVPDDAPVAASYALLPRLSSRERMFSAHYLFLGMTQFGERPYPVPADLAYTVFDDADLAVYAAQFPRTAWAAPHYAGGLERLAAAAGPLARREGTIGIYETASVTDAAAGARSGLAADIDADCLAGYEKAVVVLDGDRSIKLALPDRSDVIDGKSCRRTPESPSR